MPNEYESLSDYYIRYCNGEDCKKQLMMSIRLIAYNDALRWFKKRHIRINDYEIYDIADDTLVNVMRKVEKRNPELQLRHLIFTTGRRLFQNYVIEMRRQEEAIHELDDLNFQDDINNRIIQPLYPSYYIEPGTIMTPKTMLTIGRAAYELGYSKKHMYRIVAWDIIPWVWYGGRKVIYYKDLRWFAEARNKLLKNK